MKDHTALAPALGCGVMKNMACGSVTSLTSLLLSTILGAGASAHKTFLSPPPFRKMSHSRASGLREHQGEGWCSRESLGVAWHVVFTFTWTLLMCMLKELLQSWGLMFLHLHLPLLSLVNESNRIGHVLYYILLLMLTE